MKNSKSLSSWFRQSIKESSKDSKSNKRILIIAKIITTKSLKTNKTAEEEISNSVGVKMKNGQEDKDYSKKKKGDFVNNKTESKESVTNSERMMSEGGNSRWEINKIVEDNKIKEWCAKIKREIVGSNKIEGEDIEII